MRTIEIGDVFAIDTLKGKVLLHYVLEDKNTGAMIKVLDGFYDYSRGIDLKLVEELPEQFIVSFPIDEAYKTGIVSLIGNVPCRNFEKPKFMRTKHNIKGKFLGWHIVNTETWYRQLVLTLTDEQTKLSPWGIWNDTVLVERLNNGWSLDNWK